MKFFALIEIGEQQFVVTESNNINLQLLDEMIQNQLKRPISSKPKSELGGIDSNNRLDVFKDPVLIEKKEKEIEDLKKEIFLIEQNTKLQIAEIEQQKENIIKEAKSEMFELSKKVKALQIEVSSIREEQDKLKADIEQKKKKIINLKDFNS